jgi:hypothetical protein
MSTELGRQILDAVKTYVAGHVDRVLARVEQISTAVDDLRSVVRSLPAPETGPKGDRGDDGLTPSSDELRALIAPMIPAPIPGPAGPTGERGADGETPTVEQIEKLIRPLIPPAIPGEPGRPGEPGVPGINGRTPSADELRDLMTPLIPAPIIGERGADGLHGKDGRDGVDGRDALQLDILPTIDQSKSYCRGSYARHAGGLWRAFESTHGMRGWECLVDGIADETESVLDDGRTIVRRTVYSSGRTFERTINTSVVLDRGVYKSDAPYKPGDAVTWAGSIWIAQRRDDATPYAKPGTPNSGWRLAVKAGRDARQ